MLQVLIKNVPKIFINFHSFIDSNQKSEYILFFSVKLKSRALWSLNYIMENRIYVVHSYTNYKVVAHLLNARSFCLAWR